MPSQSPKPPHVGKQRGLLELLPALGEHHTSAQEGARGGGDALHLCFEEEAQAQILSESSQSPCTVMRSWDTGNGEKSSLSAAYVELGTSISAQDFLCNRCLIRRFFLKNQLSHIQLSKEPPWSTSHVVPEGGHHLVMLCSSKPPGCRGVPFSEHRVPGRRAFAAPSSWLASELTPSHLGHQCSAGSSGRMRKRRSMLLLQGQV